MSTTPAIVYPLMLSATSTVADARPRVRRATEVNTEAFTRGAPPAIEWVLVRRTVAFDVEWYCMRTELAQTSLESSTSDTRLVWDALDLKGRDKIDAVQLAELAPDRTAGAVILAGRRVVGILEPTAVMTGRSRFAENIAPSGAGGAAAAPSLPPPSAKSMVSLPRPIFPPSALPPAPTPSIVPAGTQSITPSIATAVAPFILEAAAFVNAPRKTQPAKPFTMQIGLAETASPDVIGGKVVIAFPVGANSIDLNVHLECAGFTCAKGRDHTLTITQSDPFTPRITLSLLAIVLPDGVDEELRAVQLLYSYGGTTCGSATYHILVQRTNAPVVVPQVTADSARVSISQDVPLIDLTLCIAWQDDNEASHTLRWSFTSPHAISAPVGKMVRGSVDLASLPVSILDEITNGDGRPEIDLLVGGIAKSIADEIPMGVWEVLKSVQRAVRDKRGVDAVPTVLLSTQETRVPWELALVPDDTIDDTRAPFLSTQFIVTRWLLDDNVRALPPSNATSPDVVAVYGDYSTAPTAADLPYAIKEAEYLSALHGTSFTASRDNVINLLLDKANHADGLPLVPGVVHFAGHGETARSNTAASFIVLNDGSTLSMTYFLNAPSLKRHHPLVFLNACQLGAATTTLGQPGGFASFCVRAGCSAVIAPLWSVNDDVAYDITREFYSDVFGNSENAPVSIAEAMYNTRKVPFTELTTTDASGVESKTRTATRLAYIVYGHPAFHPQAVLAKLP